MLIQQLVILRNITVVEIGSPHIQHQIEKQSEVEDGEIKTVTFRTHAVLHPHIDAEHPERLDKEVQKDEQTEVENEILLFHFGYWLLAIGYWLKAKS